MRKTLLLLAFVLYGCSREYRSEAVPDAVLVNGLVRHTDYGYSGLDGDRYVVAISTNYGNIISHSREAFALVSDGDSVTVRMTRILIFPDLYINGKGYNMSEVLRVW